jgi:hypothetical protein
MNESYPDDLIIPPPQSITQEAADYALPPAFDQQQKRPAKRHWLLYLAIMLAIVAAAAAYIMPSNGSTSLSMPNIRLDPNLALLLNLAPPLPAPISSPMASLSMLGANSTEPAVAKAFGNSSSTYSGASPITAPQMSGIWNGYTPMVRCEVLSTLFSLGVITVNSTAMNALNVQIPSGSDSQGNIQRFCGSASNRIKGVFPGVPAVTPNKVSLYELASAGQYVSASSSELSYLFGCDLFAGSNTTEGPSGTYVPISLSQGTGTYTMTTANPGDASSPYAPLMVSMSTNWLGFMSSLPNPANYTALANGGSVRCKSGSVNASQFFYPISLLQYFGIQLYENLYNTTVQPSIAFMSYENDTLVVNAGDISPRKGATLLSVDGNAVDSMQYYNFFVADVPLQPGNHTISLKSGNFYSLQKNLYVNPPLYLDSSLYSGTLNVTLGTAYGRNISVSNVTLDFVSSVIQNDIVETKTENAGLVGTPAVVSKSARRSFTTSLSGFCGSIGAPLEMGFTVSTDLGTAQYLVVTRCS